MKKIFIWIIYTLCALLSIICLAILIPSYGKYQKLKIRFAEQQKELDAKKNEVQRLKADHKALYQDPEAVEKVARENYKLCAKDEIVYEYDTKTIAPEK